MTDRRWAPAETYASHLLAHLMHMGSLPHSGVAIEQYKHRATRRYLNLDGTGQAWQVHTSRDGAIDARRIELADALAYVQS